MAAASDLPASSWDEDVPLGYKLVANPAVGKKAKSARGMKAKPLTTESDSFQGDPGKVESGVLQFVAASFLMLIL